MKDGWRQNVLFERLLNVKNQPESLNRWQHRERPGVKVIKLFSCYNATISLTSVNIFRECADTCIIYAQKGFITLTP
jgi:hypothetical protein